MGLSTRPTENGQHCAVFKNLHGARGTRSRWPAKRPPGAAGTPRGAGGFDVQRQRPQASPAGRTPNRDSCKISLFRCMVMSEQTRPESPSSAAREGERGVELGSSAV